MRTRVSRQWEIRVGQAELADGANKSCLCILFVLIYLLSEQLLSLGVQLTAGPRAAQIQLSSASWPLKHGQSCGQRLRGSQLTRADERTLKQQLTGHIVVLEWQLLFLHKGFK